jgi:hypothetical protein
MLSYFVALLIAGPFATKAVLVSPACTFDRDQTISPVEWIRRLVGNAHVIVRARATQQLGPLDRRRREDHVPWGLERDVEFKVLEVIAGTNVRPTLRIPGTLSTVMEDLFSPDTVPYLYGTASGGSCFNWFYKKNGEYLLILSRLDGQLTPYFSPMAPTNEQVRGAHDPWVRWVRDERRRSRR